MRESACCLCFGFNNTYWNGSPLSNCSVPASTAGPHHKLSIGHGLIDACNLCALSPTEWAASCRLSRAFDGSTRDIDRNDWLVTPTPRALPADQARHCLLAQWVLAKETGRTALFSSNASAQTRRTLLRARPSLKGKRVLILEDLRLSASTAVKRDHQYLRKSATESNLVWDLVRIRFNTTENEFASIDRGILTLPPPDSDQWVAANLVVAHLKNSKMSLSPDGVLSWYDGLVPLADNVATLLGVPSGRRHLGAGAPPPENKLAARAILLKHKGRLSLPEKALAFARIRTPSEAISAVRRTVGFPCFLKPSSGAGGSAGKVPHLLSGRVDSEAQLRKAARAHERASSVAILERYLEGPEVYAECVVHQGKALAVSLRAAVSPELLQTSARPYTWEWPAMLSQKDHARCTAVAAEVLQALDVLNGVYGVQLIVDKILGCSFVELNMRPTNWPSLHDATFQLMFMRDVWLYSVCALMAAIGQDPSPYMLLSTAPPLQLSMKCAGGWRKQLNYLPEEIALYGTRRMDPTHGCIVDMRPFADALAAWP